MQGAGSTPGGYVDSVAMFPFVRWMTMVHEAVGADLDENPFAAIETAAFQQLASSFRIHKPETTYLKKNAIKTHYMPRHKQNTIADWDAAYNDDYNGVACCGAWVGKRTGPQARIAAAGWWAWMSARAMCSLLREARWSAARSSASYWSGRGGVAV